MKEIFPGVFSWQQVNEKGPTKKSYLINAGDARYVVDPVWDEQVMTEISQSPITGIFLMTSSHKRDIQKVNEYLKTTIYASAQTTEQVKEIVEVRQVVADGAELPGGITAIHLLGTSGGEMALYYPGSGGAMFIADGLITDEDGNLGLLPDKFLSDKERLLNSLTKLLEYDFECLIASHGIAVTSSPKSKLKALLA